MGNWPRLYGPLEIPYWPSITRHCSKHSVILQDKSFLLISLFPQSQKARLMSGVRHRLAICCPQMMRGHPFPCQLLSILVPPSLLYSFAQLSHRFSLEAYCAWIMMTSLGIEEWRWTNFWAMECYLHVGSRGKVYKEEALENWSKYLSEKKEDIKM